MTPAIVKAQRDVRLAITAWVLVALAASIMACAITWTFAPGVVAVLVGVGAVIVVGALTFAEVEQAHDALIDAVLEDGEL
jgi:hypothetical protein